MKAIQTQYAGCHFRSRLEARWAVFFDAMEIGWEYEPQGFELGGGRYLPDFWLPQSEVWIEIKGHAPNKSEIAKFLDLASEVAHQNHRCRLLVGDIPRPPLPTPIVPCYLASTEYVVIAGKDVDGNDIPPAAVSPEGTLEIELRHHMAGIPREYWRVIPGMWMPGHSLETINAALGIARSARFEFGQSGAVS